MGTPSWLQQGVVWNTGQLALVGAATVSIVGSARKASRGVKALLVTIA